MNKDLYQLEEYECSICLDNNEKEKYTTSCKHCFHKECIKKWLEKAPTCPI